MNVSACTFFGHRDAPREILPNLHAALLDLIENHSVQKFYVGNQGAFDAMVRRQLSMLEKTHGIHYYVVLAYLPKQPSNPETASHTLYPEGLETVPLRFAICKRNLWMLERSEFVIVYTRNTTGGAVRFRQLAERKGRTVIAV